jgi:hypothetical protein
MLTEHHAVYERAIMRKLLRAFRVFTNRLLALFLL